MKFFKKAEANTQVANTIRTLSAADLTAVSGGINPQPLPPCRAMKL